MNNEEGVLRERARAAMSTGQLPRRRPDRMWGGPGTGATCAICGYAVSGEEMGFDLEFTLDELPASAVNHQFHVRCFAAWEFERDNPREAHSAGNGRARVLRSNFGDATISGRERDGYPRGPE